VDIYFQEQNLGFVTVIGSRTTAAYSASSYAEKDMMHVGWRDSEAMLVQPTHPHKCIVKLVKQRYVGSTLCCMIQLIGAN
jgi:hypothetical protein